jgi:hypothetical protein
MNPLTRYRVILTHVPPPKYHHSPENCTRVVMKSVSDRIIQDEGVDDPETSFCNGRGGIKVAAMSDGMPSCNHEMGGRWSHEPDNTISHAS